MEIAKTYDPKSIEERWYANWMDHGYFHSEPDNREPYTIVIPPPNVTGMLHMGHILNNTIQDILVRRARLQGRNACWVPGMDHASIATEAKVVDMLSEKGINKDDLTREDFLKHAWEWKEKYGGIILKQLQKLGASCDWDRTTFTMDPDYYGAVIQVFNDLHDKGLIYRGARMINWDPDAQTALSNEEVNYKEVASKLYYVNYKIVGEDGHVTIATTRPETILGDSAVCFNPEDERFKGMEGKKVVVPLVNREVPLIADSYVDMEFGTGALKITPSHDVNDYEIGIKYKLEAINIFEPDGTMSEAAQLYVGEDRFVVRKKMAAALEEEGLLEKVEDYTNKVGYSERTNAVIEPRISIQWFMKMSELVKPALEHVMDDTIHFHPENQKNTYRHWMENIQDWCISRQLWWGQRIPAWYLPDGEFVVAENEEAALAKAQEQDSSLTQADLKQDEDVLDTWFSSWIWPIEVFKGFSHPEDNKELDYYNPTSTLVTAPDIIFFWVARMAMSNYEYLDRPPFSDVYFTGLVRDKQGRKMSKSLGNSPDPLDLMDQYGTDAVRFGILIASPAGNDLLFDDKMCEQGRNFCNKIWNAMRLVDQWTPGDADGDHSFAIEWFRGRLANTVAELDGHFNDFTISEALKKLYSLIWDDFCSWYLEMIKPGQDKVLNETTYQQTIEFFEELMTLLHPFMPFVSEEIYHILSAKGDNETIMFNSWPKAEKSAIADHPFLEVVSNLRNIRAENNIAPKEKLNLAIKTPDQATYQLAEQVITKLGNLEELAFVTESVENAKSFLIGTDEFFVPIEVDEAAEREKLQKDLEYHQGFLRSVEAKLANENFVSKAPKALVDKEEKKKSDAEEKIRLLEEAIAKLV